ncbi:MAG: hypothetical protein JRF41_12475 [Deltaproteobacteria bacterium]|nr:hypothetical protein [Deltaproteobacteria bacterium]
MSDTKPKPAGIGPDTPPVLLYLGRYGTDSMIDLWGPEQTFQFSLEAQSAAVKMLSELHPQVVPPEKAEELAKAATLGVIDPQRIREIESATGHDVIAINRAWAEKVDAGAATHINKARTSADTTETAKALQIKSSIQVIIDSLENLRDITIEKAVKWMDVPHMDTTHWIDALPTRVGRPFSFYAEMLQADLDFWAFVYSSSIMGKWADATGNHHSATALDINGIELQDRYCESLGLKHMIANAQVPGREYLADVIYAMARTAETINNLAFYIAWGKGSDVSLFYDDNPQKRKGSSAMPHKDMVGGNPTAEEQAESFANLMRGNLVTALSSCKFRYGRDLSGSASDRDIFNSAFKFGDHVIRRIASTIYYLGLNEERSKERVTRTYGVITAQQVMTYLTDQRRTNNPMTREDAHDLMGELATIAYQEKRSFLEVLLADNQVTDRLDSKTLEHITDPFQYIGQSKEIIKAVAEAYYGKKKVGTNSFFETSAKHRPLADRFVRLSFS